MADHTNQAKVWINWFNNHEDINQTNASRSEFLIRFTQDKYLRECYKTTSEEKSTFFVGRSPGDNNEFFFYHHVNCVQRTEILK